MAITTSVYASNVVILRIATQTMHMRESFRAKIHERYSSLQFVKDPCGLRWVPFKHSWLCRTSEGCFTNVWDLFEHSSKRPRMVRKKPEAGRGMAGWPLPTDWRPWLLQYLELKKLRNKYILSLLTTITLVMENSSFQYPLLCDLGSVILHCYMHFKTPRYLQDHPLCSSSRSSMHALAEWPESKSTPECVTPWRTSFSCQPKCRYIHLCCMYKFKKIDTHPWYSLIVYWIMQSIYV